MLYRARMRALLVMVIVLVGLLTGQPGRRGVGVAAADCPALDVIQRRAEAFAGLDGTPRWRTRSRWAAVVPVISARATTDVGWEEASVSRSAVGPIDREQGFDVRMTWRLERLVFDPDEPRLFDAERRARRDRIALRQEVAAAYFRWQRAALLEATSPDGALAVTEAFALLDAFTGGWLARRKCE